MSSRERPLSPHLQIYRPQITSIASIMHRLTGVALYGGLFLLTWWLAAAAAGGGYYETFSGFAASWIGRLVLFGWSWALCYHFVNGIRHLFWDAGYCFDIAVVKATGWIAVLASLALTAAIWVLGYMVLLG